MTEHWAFCFDDIQKISASESQQTTKATGRPKQRALTLEEKDWRKVILRGEELYKVQMKIGRNQNKKKGKRGQVERNP